MHHLHRGSKDGATNVGAGLEERSGEAVGPRADPAGGRDEAALVLLVGDDLSKLGLDVLGVGGLSTKTAEGKTSLLNGTTLDEETRGVGEEEETDGEDDTPGELDTNGNAVSAAAWVVLGSVVDAGSDQDTEGNGELVTRHESTADLAGGDLGHVEDDDGRFETYTDTGDETTGNDEAKTGGGDLEDDTDDVDDATKDDGKTTTDNFSGVTSDEGTEEGSYEVFESVLQKCDGAFKSGVVPAERMETIKEV